LAEFDDMPRSDGVLDFVDAPVRLVLAGLTVWEESDRNGIEGAALSHLRDGLIQLVDGGQGTVRFGDHDYSDLVVLVRHPDQPTRLKADIPSLDRWDIPLPTMPVGALQRMIDQIDLAEAEFGPLTGSCMGCGDPWPQWEPNPR
jgi:hypothetical protein